MDIQTKQPQPPLKREGAPKAKLVNGGPARVAELPREGNGTSGPAVPDSDSLSWRVRKRPPQPIATDYTETVIIQAGPSKAGALITQVQPGKEAAGPQDKKGFRASHRQDRNAGGLCSSAFFRRCLPWRSRPSSATKKASKEKSAAMLPKDQGKKTLVLDLDETLVRSTFARTPAYTFVVNVELDGKERCIYINKRPGVNVFLKEVSKWFELVVFTASVAKYADIVLDKLDPMKLCSWRLFREYCTYLNGSFVKDLSLLGRDLRNIIIVDNSTRAYLWHAENAIPIKSWFDDPHDRELLDLIPMLQLLACVDDIRPVIRDVLLRLD